jgi:hypothetical protein
MRCRSLFRHLGKKGQRIATLLAVSGLLGLAGVIAGPATFTATTNINVAPTSYVIAIYDETSSTLLGFCSTGTTCSMHTEPSVDGDFLVAFISTFIQVVSQHYPPPLNTLHASSNVVLSRGFYG